MLDSGKLKPVTGWRRPLGFVEGVEAITCPTSPGENTILSGCTAQRSGVRRVPALTIMGTCPNAVQGTATITSLYGASFPLPVENERIFVSAHQMTNGWKGPAIVFSALCPASSE